MKTKTTNQLVRIHRYDLHLHRTEIQGLLSMLEMQGTQILVIQITKKVIDVTKGTNILEEYMMRFQYSRESLEK